jgi:hypothetical protein
LEIFSVGKLALGTSQFSRHVPARRSSLDKRVQTQDDTPDDYYGNQGFHVRSPYGVSQTLVQPQLKTTRGCQSVFSPLLCRLTVIN